MILLARVCLWPNVLGGKADAFNILLPGLPDNIDGPLEWAASIVFLYVFPLRRRISMGHWTQSFFFVASRVELRGRLSEFES